MARKTLYFPDGLYERLEARAGELERSPSWCAQRAVEAWLEDSPTPEGADRAGVAAPDAGGAARTPATPRASAVQPVFQRATSLGAGSKPIPRRTR